MYAFCRLPAGTNAALRCTRIVHAAATLAAALAGLAAEASGRCA